MKPQRKQPAKQNVAKTGVEPRLTKRIELDLLSGSLGAFCLLLVFCHERAILSLVPCLDRALIKSSLVHSYAMIKSSHALPIAPHLHHTLVLRHTLIMVPGRPSTQGWFGACSNCLFFKVWTSWHNFPNSITTPDFLRKKKKIHL